MVNKKGTLQRNWQHGTKDEEKQNKNAEFDGTTTHLNGYFSSQVDNFRYVIVLGRYQNRLYKILNNNLKGEGNPTTVFCRKAHVLFTLVVYVCVMLCLPHIVVGLFLVR
jgi:hypothetical protein